MFNLNNLSLIPKSLRLESDIVLDMQVKCHKCNCKLNKNNWSQGNKKYYKNICKFCSNEQCKKRRIKIKKEVIDYYGGECACCHESELTFLTIDHIDNSGAHHRKTIRANTFYTWLKNNNYPTDNYQVLCFNCNFAKHVLGACPHQS